MIKRLAILILIVATAISGKAQIDVVYSQANVSTISFNPATAGIFYGGYRLTSNYRTAWTTVGNPFTTTQVSFDMPVHDNIWENDFIAAGFTVTSDVAGASGYTNNTVLLLGSYGKALDAREHHFFSVGFSGGVSQKSVTYQSLNWESQFDRIGFNQGLPTGEIYIDENANSGSQAMHLDFGLGVNYVYNNESTMLLRAGVSIEHVNAPTYEFFGDPLQVYERVNMHVDLRAKPRGSTLSFWPKAMYTIQGPHRVLFFGSDLHYLLQEAGNITGHVKEISFSIGPYYRYKEGMSIHTRFQVGGLHVGLAYDFNLNKLRTASNKLGGPELLLYYQGGYKKGRNEKHNHKSFTWKYE